MDYPTESVDLRYGRTPPNPVPPLTAMVVELNFPWLMAVSARKEDLSSNAMTKLSLSVKALPQICSDRSADDEKTEGMSTSTDELGDLLIRNIWKHQTDCTLDPRITNIDTPSSIHRKPEAGLFPMNVKFGRNTSKPAWTNAITSLPCWFHMMECLENEAKVH